MNVTASTSASAGWTALAAWSEVRHARAQLTADIAAGADPQVIAADRGVMVSSAQRLTHSASKIDLLV
jgi:hypothetical protein